MSSTIQVPEFIASGVFQRPIPKNTFLPDVESSTDLLEYYRQAQQMLENAKNLLDEVSSSDFAIFSAEALAERNGLKGNKPYFHVNASGDVELKFKGGQKVSIVAPETHSQPLSLKTFPEPRRVVFTGIQHREKPVLRLESNSSLEKNEIPQVDLDSETIPKPRMFRKALIKVLGYLTNHNSSMWVLAEDEVIDLVLKEVGIDPLNSPWPVYNSDDDSYQSLKRNITYAYRNSKEGYNQEDKAVFRATEKPKAWALTDLGSKISKEFNQQLASVVPAEIKVSEDVDTLFDEDILPENNRTLRWINEKGEVLRVKLLKYAERFRISHANGLLEDHVHEFLFDMIRRDKIGKWSDRREGKMPSLSHVKNWLGNHITDQLENSAKEPVCRALYGAETKAIRKSKKRIKDGTDKASDHRWAKTCANRPEVSGVKRSVVHGYDSEDNIKIDFVCPNSTSKMEGDFAVKQMISTISNDFSPEEKLHIEQLLCSLNDGEEINLPEQIMCRLKASAAKVAEDAGLCHLVPDDFEPCVQEEVLFSMLSDGMDSTGHCQESVF